MASRGATAIRFEGGFQIALWEVDRDQTLGAVYYYGRRYKIDYERDPDAPSDSYRVILFDGDGSTHVVAIVSTKYGCVLDGNRGVWDSMTIREIHAVEEIA